MDFWVLHSLSESGTLRLKGAGTCVSLISPISDCYGQSHSSEHGICRRSDLNCVCHVEYIMSEIIHFSSVDLALVPFECDVLKSQLLTSGVHIRNQLFLLQILCSFHYSSLHLGCVSLYCHTLVPGSGPMKVLDNGLSVEVR